MSKSPWDKIPRMDVDWSKPWPEIADRAADAYQKVAVHCSNEVLRAEIWKLAAVSSWLATAFVICCWIAKK